MIEVSGQIVSNHTGKLYRVSNRGKRSVMVLYNYNINDTLTVTFKNHMTQELARSQTRLVQYLLDRGLKPSALSIENKCPESLQNVFRENSINIQICPPKDHHINQAEKAIDTWNLHLLSGLSGVEPNFTMNLWCRLLPHVTQTLNPLHRSRINSRLSEESQLNEAFY